MRSRCRSLAFLPTAALAVALCVTLGGASAATGEPTFESADDGGFTFDTGVLRGRLRAGGKSYGLQEVIHVPTGRRMDRANGLLSHYRVFANGRRFGAGAWDWPSTARRREDGAVEIRWDATAERPFSLTAAYRWRDRATVEVETGVEARDALRGFEVYLASYFEPSFTNSLVCVALPENAGKPSFIPATRDAGDWQMFPRDELVVDLIQDGRWKLEPHPVAWVLRPKLALPILRRRAPTSGLSGVLMAPAGDCFAVSTPYETEEHYSAYLSLFGDDIPAGASARARARWTAVVAKSDAAVMDLYVQASREWLTED